MNQRLVSMSNVHTLTTYELRQEVECRGVLDEISVVNYNTLLEKMVQVLVREERERSTFAKDAAVVADSGADPAAGGQETLQDRLQRQREERKREAEERSRQRQANAAYFRARQEANDEGKARAAARAAAASSSTDGGSSSGSRSGGDAVGIGEGLNWAGATSLHGAAPQPVAADGDDEPLFSKGNPKRFKVFTR